MRGLTAADLGGPADLVVADLSFISLTLVLGDLAGLMGQDADLVVLVKPQFEVGRGGSTTRASSPPTGTAPRPCSQVVDAVGDHGLHVHGIRPSPISGTTGNAEYLLWARSDPSDTMSQDRVRALAREITSATSGGRR